MTPTAEQLAIINAATSTKANLLVNARAGAAKTTTIELICHALPGVSTLAIAFNKKIAVALQERLPPHCTAMTLNSLGNKMWRDFIGKWPKVEPRKSYLLLKDLLDPLPGKEKDDAYEIFNEVLEGIRVAKSVGYLPAGVHPQAKPLISREEFYNISLEFEPSPLHVELIEKILRLSFIESFSARIDFDDQIYMPALMSCSFSPYALTVVDEAQDLSPINHVLLSKVVKNNRIIAVGDPCQAIYGFRGASQHSMEELRERFSMKEFYLTICFRSAQKIVKNARWRAPDMAWRDGASEGTIEKLKTWDASAILDGDAIICRNNAPLFSMALNLLQAGRSPELLSGDILANLQSTLKKLGKPTTPSEVALTNLQDWEDAQDKKRKDKRKLHDTAECLRIFLRTADTLSQASSALENICTRPGRIKLMTGHKSKGLEFDRVFFLDQYLLKRGEGQDANIEYVISTRPREALFYVESAGWIAG